MPPKSPAPRPVRLGRPPASSSAETRTRILQVARQSFAELGYGVTTNKYLATKVGITTGALYHYFDSKIDIYAAVYSEVTERVFDRFEAAIVGIDTFIGRFEAILEEAHRLNDEDHSLARFLGAARSICSGTTRSAPPSVPCRSAAWSSGRASWTTASRPERSRQRTASASTCSCRSCSSA